MSTKFLNETITYICPFGSKLYHNKTEPFSGLIRKPLEQLSKSTDSDIKYASSPTYGKFVAPAKYGKFKNCKKKKKSFPAQI